MGEGVRCGPGAPPGPRAVTPASRGRRAGRQPGTGGQLTLAGPGPRHLLPPLRPGAPLRTGS